MVSLIKFRMSQKISEAHLWMCLWEYFQKRLTYGQIHFEFGLDNAIGWCLGKNKIGKKTSHLNAYIFFLFSILLEVTTCCGHNGLSECRVQQRHVLNLLKLGNESFPLVVFIRYYEHNGKIIIYQVTCS